MPPNTYLPISTIARKAANDLVDLLIVQGQVGTLLGVSVGIEAMLLSNAQMRDVLTVLVNDFSLGVVEAKLAVLDAELPATAHGLVVVLDTEGLAFGHTDLVGRATAGADGVIDASQTNILDGSHPIVRGYFVGLAFALVRVGTKSSSRSRSFLGADDRSGRCPTPPGRTAARARVS